jgi:hypothetical protein
VHAFLVAGDYAEAVAFAADDQLPPPSELLYKRALVLAPGRLDSVDQMHADFVSDTLAQVPEEELKESKGELGLFCLAVAASAKDQKALAEGIVEHVKALQQLGYGVMVFRARELYEMSVFVNRYTKSRVHFAVGLAVLARVFEDRYKELPGSLLEAIAHLFTQNVRVTVYPMAAEAVQKRAQLVGLAGWAWTETDGVVTADNFHPSGPVNSLYQYLLESKFILPGKPVKRREAAQG